MISFDSYPYACIIMLSHTDGMIGGETFIKRGDGAVTKVEGPRYGHAYIIQGGILGKYCMDFYFREVWLI